MVRIYQIWIDKKQTLKMRVMMKMIMIVQKNKIKKFKYSVIKIFF